MKKIYLFTAIIILTVSFWGCIPKYRVTFMDEITKKPLPTIYINGKDYAKEEIFLSKGTYTVSAPLYEEKQVDISGDGTVALTPAQYCLISANASVEKILIDEKEYTPASLIRDGKALLCISPVEIGIHTLRCESRFFEPVEKTIEIKKGENIVSLTLVENKKAFSQYLDTLKFPLETDGTITVKISGIANKNSIEKTVTAKKVNDTLEIKDDFITYTYKNGQFEMDGRTVDSSTYAILRYSLETIEHFLNLRSVLSNWTLVRVNGNEFTVTSTGTFEDRLLKESVDFKVENQTIVWLTLSIVEDNINTNLKIEVEVD